MLDSAELFTQAQKAVNRIMSKYGHARLYNIYNFHRGDGVLGQELSLEKAKVEKESQHNRQQASSVNDLIQNLLNTYLSSVQVRVSEKYRMHPGGEVYVREIQVPIFRETGRSTDYDGYDKETVFSHYEYEYIVGITTPQFKGPGSLEKQLSESLNTLRYLCIREESKAQRLKDFSYNHPVYWEVYSLRMQIEKAMDIIKATENQLSSFDLKMKSLQETSRGNWATITNKTVDSLIKETKLKKCKLEQESRKSEDNCTKLKTELKQQKELLLQYRVYLTAQSNLLNQRKAIMDNRTNKTFPISNRQSVIDNLEKEIKNQEQINQDLLNKVKELNSTSNTVLVFDSSSNSTIIQCIQSSNRAITSIEKNLLAISKLSTQNRKELEKSTAHFNFLQEIKSTFINPKGIMEGKIKSIIATMKNSIESLFPPKSTTKEKILSM